MESSVIGSVDRSPWTSEGRSLWHRLRDHPFENASLDLDFTQRLARDRAWTLAFARAAVEEYRCFCFLAVVSPTPVTPSEEVDEVWHQHLVYSRDYWDLWCGVALGRALHHDPTPGGRAAGQTYRAQYAATLALYERYFGAPPLALWPATHRRFRAPRFRTVDRERTLTIPRAAFALRRVQIAIAAVLAVVPGPARAQTLNPLDWSGTPFLWLMLVLSAAAVGLALRRRRSIRGRSGTDWRGGPLTAIELAFLAGGPTRAADTAIVERFDAGADTDPADGPSIGDVARLRSYREHADWRRNALLRLQPVLAGVRASLIGRGLLPDDESCHRLWFAALQIISPVILFGLVKVVVGVSRHRPVGFLVILLLVLTAVGIGIASKPRRTLRGDAALAVSKERSVRAARAPLPGELALAFALGGAAVLVGTPAEAYGAVLRKLAIGGDGGGSVDGGCGGGGSGGCGGGGCGGCSG